MFESTLTYVLDFSPDVLFVSGRNQPRLRLVYCPLSTRLLLRAVRLGGLADSATVPDGNNTGHLQHVEDDGALLCHALQV